MNVYRIDRYFTQGVKSTFVEAEFYTIDTSEGRCTANFYVDDTLVASALGFQEVKKSSKKEMEEQNSARAPSVFDPIGV
jgi:hypothetical protein